MSEPSGGGRRGRRQKVALVRRVFLLTALCWVISLVAVVAWGTRNADGTADAVVVLGAAQYDGRPSPVLRARLDHAVKLWKAGRARWLIVTGGRGSGDTTSEAAVGRRYAVRQGVTAELILLEDQGRTTSASMSGVADIMRQRGLRRAIFVSDPFHMLRLAILARRHGLDAAPSPTRTSPISASPSQSLGYMLSESVKVPVTIILALVGR